MKTNYIINNKRFEVWSDFIDRATYARNEAGDIKKIYGGGYISNELTVRKAIARAYGLSSFRGKKV